MASPLHDVIMTFVFALEGAFSKRCLETLAFAPFLHSGCIESGRFEAFAPNVSSQMIV